jgi:hypothetical protein
MIGELALVVAALFAGAAVIINVAEQPARLSLPDGPMLLEWQNSYNRAAPMQGGLAMASFVLGCIAAWQAWDMRWLLGATLMIANWPYTLFIIKPTNDRLHALGPEQANAASRAMIVSWGHLHAVRSGLSVAACGAYVWAMH